jgi:hypothetical protein
MAGSSVAGIITAIASGILALAALVSAFTVFIPMARRVRHTEETAERTEQVAKSTHVLVNSRYDNIENFNRALIRALNKHGIEVPIDQSLPDNPP